MGAGREARHLPMIETDLVQGVRSLANEVWHQVVRWESFAQRTVGKQLTTSLDSVGANLVEGDGRYRDGDALHFFTIARGSLREAEYWLLLSNDRGLITASDFDRFRAESQRLGRMLNSLVNYRRRTLNAGIARESAAPYDVDEQDVVLDAPGLAPHA